MADHRFWRIRVTATGDGGPVIIQEIEFRNAVGGADTTEDSSYGLSASSEAAGFEALNAIDNAVGAPWKALAEAADIAYDYNQDYPWYNFQDIVEFTITADSAGNLSAPKDFYIDYSDDGWGTYTEASAHAGVIFTSGEKRTFSVGAVLPVVDISSPVLSLTNRLINDISSPLLSFTSRLINDISAPLLSFTSRLIDDISTPRVSFSSRVFAPATPTVAFKNTVNADQLGHRFQLQIMLGGVDMSARLTGGVSVDFGESVARLASFTLMPFSGIIDPYQWIDSTVLIDVLTFDSAGARQTNHRIFSGTVDVPVYDPGSGLTTFDCTDGLQQSFEAKTFEQIALEVGGYHSAVCTGEPREDEKWDYARDRIDSMAASFQFNAYGGLVKTEWEAKSQADITLEPGDIIDQSIDLSLVSSRRLINTVNIKFSHRYARKWQREISAQWAYPRSFSEFLSESTSLPNRQMVLGALNSQWLIKSVHWTKLPPSGAYPDFDGITVLWNITDDFRQQLIFGASFVLSRRWLQDVTETYALSIRADASIAQHGVVAEALSYALDEPVDDEFENTLEPTATSITSAGDEDDTETGYSYRAPEAGSVPIDDTNYVLDPTDRADYENAVMTAQQLAIVRILKSHRSNQISCDTLFNPAIEVGKTLRVNHSKISGQGVVASGSHLFDVAEGVARTRLNVAIYQPNVAAQTAQPVAVPTAPDVSPSVAPQSISLSSYFGGKTETEFDESWLGYVGNWNTRVAPSAWHSSQFRVDIPPVEDAARDAQEFTVDSSLTIAIPQDDLIITAG